MTKSDQLPLIEAESDDALLMPDTERAKRYTARQAKKISERLDLILAFMACKMKVDEVARKAHITQRTVNELGGIYAARIAADMARYGDWALGLSAKFLWLADQKSHEADFDSLIKASSFIGRNAMDMKMQAGGLNLAGEEHVLDVESDNPALVSARKRLAERNQPTVDVEEVKA